MTKIKVDHNELKKKAETVQSYVSSISKIMSKANNASSMLPFAGWGGEDAKAFIQQFSLLDDNQSSYSVLKNKLMFYSDYLTYASKKYSETQAAAVNRSRKI